MEGRSVPTETSPRTTSPVPLLVPGGEVGASSSFSPLLLRGFHRQALMGKGAPVRGERGVRMGAPAMAPWKALINSPRQSKPHHANEGNPAPL